MKTLKLDQFEKFECNVTQMEKVKGGEYIYTGIGQDVVHGGYVEDFIDSETNQLIHVKIECR